MAKLTVLGIGNILMRDEGIGVVLLDAVQAARAWSENVEFVDGGVGGLNLLTVIEEATRLIVFDAADMGLAAGQYRVISPEQVLEEDLSGRVSLHEVPFVETLRLCEQFFRRPPTTILAIQPAVVEHGRQLSPEISGALETLAAAAIKVVEDALNEDGK